MVLYIRSIDRYSHMLLNILKSSTFDNFELKQSFGPGDLLWGSKPKAGERENTEKNWEDKIGTFAQGHC